MVLLPYRYHPITKKILGRLDRTDIFDIKDALDTNKAKLTNFHIVIIKIEVYCN